MKVGMIGLGKLGLPVAVAMAHQGHDVTGYDANPQRMSKNPPAEAEAGLDGGVRGFDALLASSTIKFDTLEGTVRDAEIIFVAIQTPHQPQFEGVTPLPPSRADFDYIHLVRAVGSLVPWVVRDTPVVIISTCLPGTVAREILPVCSVNPHIRICYNPFFIAMGTVVYDFLNPEFVLLGVDDPWAGDQVEQFYKETIPWAGVRRMSIPSAELTKVAYNTYISFKIGFVNLLQEICHKIPGSNVDDVTNALKCADKRLISTAYMSAGMGDGGGCHPRDNIAMSYLAETLDLGFDLFESVMLARQGHAEWIARIIINKHQTTGLPVVVLGVAFKPETNLITGSPSRLVVHYLKRRIREDLISVYDPHVLPDHSVEWKPAIYFIGCKHAWSETYLPPEGSVVIDPFRYWVRRPGIEYIPLGKGV